MPITQKNEPELDILSIGIQYKYEPLPPLYSHLIQHHVPVCLARGHNGIVITLLRS